MATVEEPPVDADEGHVLAQDVWDKVVADREEIESIRIELASLPVEDPTAELQEVEQDQ